MKLAPESIKSNFWSKLSEGLLNNVLGIVFSRFKAMSIEWWKHTALAILFSKPKAMSMQWWRHTGSKYTFLKI